MSPFEFDPGAKHGFYLITDAAQQCLVANCTPEEQAQALSLQASLCPNGQSSFSSRFPRLAKRLADRGLDAANGDDRSRLGRVVLDR